MISAFIDGYGQDQILRVGDFPAPKPGPSDVLVKVHAASVNPIDFKLRNGKVRLLRRYRFPLILGHDGAGEVVEIGEKVTQFKVGDRIFSRPRNGRIGTFAEFIAIDQSEAALMPPTLNYQEAASLPLVALTSWQALVDVAQLKPGQKLLIHAGSGGIGTFAIQLAKRIGAEVWTTTSGKNEEFVRSLGADHVINYQNEEFEQRGNNLDVVFDTLGGDSLDKSFTVVRPGGLVVSDLGTTGLPRWQGTGFGYPEMLARGCRGIPSQSKRQESGE